MIQSLLGSDFVTRMIRKVGVRHHLRLARGARSEEQLTCVVGSVYVTLDFWETLSKF